MQHKATGKAKKVRILVKNIYRLDVYGISTEISTIGKCEKAMQLTLERELDLHASKIEPQDVEKPQDEDYGVGSTTYVDKKKFRWAEGVHAAIPPVERWGDMHDSSQEKGSGGC